MAQAEGAYAMWTGVNICMRMAALILCGLFAWAGPGAAQNRAPDDCRADCARARDQVAALVAEFDANRDFYTSRGFSEADAREKFIDPFFEALGWDVDNSSAFELYQQDTIPEARLWKEGAVHYADYAFRIDGRSFIMVEAEAMSRDVDNAEHIEQAIGYAWSSAHAEIAILTDFEELRVFDVRNYPNADNYEEYEIMSLHLNHDQFTGNFQTIWETLSKNAVISGRLKELLVDRNITSFKAALDEAFLLDLDGFRLRLGQAVHATNPGLESDRLNEAVHHILNQLVFSRILEDRDIEPTGRLREAVEVWKVRGGNASLWSFIRAELGRLERRYNGVVFAAHFSDELTIPDDALLEIIEALYPPVSEYSFATVPIEILGRAYESYLGRKLETTDGRVSLAPRPEVRRAGGVFYTPKWVVDYILDATLTPKLEAKTPAELVELRLLDPACGAGAFSVQMADRILAAALQYYADNPNQIGGTDTAFPDAYTLHDGTLKLSVTKKAELISEAVFCVDVDPQAAEITQMWLYILILEDEASPIITQERRYKIPNRINKPDARKFVLPDLSGNIINGNSLVGSDFSDVPFERERVKAFDWDAGTSRLAKTTRAGGFDVIAGNPPYLSIADARLFIPKQYDYMRKIYKSMGTGQADMSYGFVEKGLSLLNPRGKLSYITSNGFLWNRAGHPLREIIAESGALSEIADLGTAKVFKDASPAIAIVMFDNEPHDTIRHARYTRANEDGLVTGLPSLAFQTFPISRLDNASWAFPAEEDRDIYDVISAHSLRIGDVANAFTGITTGADGVFLVEPVDTSGAISKVKVRNSDALVEVETAMLRPFLRGRHIRRYQPLAPAQMVIYPHDEDGKPYSTETMRTRFPRTYEYLEQNRIELEARRSLDAGRAVLHSLARARDPQLLFSPKLITGWKAGKAQFTIDPSGDLSFSGGLIAGVVSTDADFSLEMLLGLLNSEPVFAYARTVRPELWSGISFSPTFIESIPIVPMSATSRPIYKMIGARAKQVLARSAAEDTGVDAAKIIQLEAEIDELVAKLYRRGA